MPRIPYPDPEQVPQALKDLAATRLPLNIYRMLMHAETAMPGYVALVRSLLQELKLDPALREIATLRAGTLSRSPYVVQNHLKFARAVGVSEDKIQALVEGRDSPAFTDLERLVIRFTEEVIRDVKASDATFRAVAAHLGSREVAELVLVIGFYAMTARFLETLEVDPDLNVQGAAFSKFYTEG
jgi:alkylhydroperoxidase family enzyme